MQVQPVAAAANATVVGLVDGVKKKDFPLKFCTVCASNQNRFVPLPSCSFFSLSFLLSRFYVIFTSDGASVPGFLCRGFFFVSSVEKAFPFHIM